MKRRHSQANMRNQAAAQAKFAEGLTFHRAGQPERARELYREALALQPRHFDALHLLAVIAAQSGNAPEAISLFDQALAVNPKAAVVHFNRGNALQESGRHALALDSYQRALALEPAYPEAYFNSGCALSDLKRLDEAIASYDRAITLRPGYVRAHFNRANALRHLGRLPEAVEGYNAVLAHDPSHVDALNNRATTLRDLKRFTAAIADYRRAIEFKPEFADAWANLGASYLDVREYAIAVEHFDRAIALGSQAPHIQGNRLHAKMHICDWRNVAAETADLVARVERGEAASSPFVLLSLFDSPALHRKLAEALVAARRAELDAPISEPSLASHGKIRIGYYSANFYNHAVSYLMAGLFEHHDRNRFELFAFSFGPDKHDEMRRRLRTTFDRFFDVQSSSDRDIALLSRQLEIDIAVDLNGFTGDGRPDIFIYRAAPLQVAYIGYPGTTGMPTMDYLLADRTLIGTISRPHYSEKIIALPHSYQANDSRREIAARCFTRGELGLPERGFVFCCFNSSYKILPSTFDVWMRLLHRIEGSVLWLLGDSPAAIANLRREAAARGIDGGRLVFAERMPLAEHLARHRAADLFIDTQPYNAHTTASDALWAGLPVLTCIGESFASRVAASLLQAVHLPELITTTEAEYEALALVLATRPQRLAELRGKLSANLRTAPLFDTALLANDIERAYTLIYRRRTAGLPPVDLDLASPRCST